MSNPNPFNYPVKGVTPKQAEEWTRKVNDAPILEIPPGRSVTKHVKRVGFLRPDNPIQMFTGQGLTSWIELTDLSVYRLPESMNQWAVDTVSVMLAMGGNNAVGAFPATVRFSAKGIDILGD